jgi:glyoxylase-like metal-dependent hydrolase (beta-lactamase superfamily II)
VSIATGPGAGHWTDPGAYEVADGVHRIPLPLPMDGLRAVNVYVLETEEGLTLVDGGWAIEDSRRQLEHSLASMGRKVADITRFLVTHAHRDHYTQAVTVRREFGSHISLGLGDKPTLDLARDATLGVNPMVAQVVRAGADEVARAWASSDVLERRDLSIWEPPDTWLDRDLSVTVGTRTLDAVSTPGHTQGHYVFADRAAGLLFAGDHVLPTITPSIGFEPTSGPLPLRDFLESLAKVRAMPDLRLLPAHGPVTTSTHARVDELVAHHDDRLRQCRTAVGVGHVTAYEVARDLPWTRHARHFDELDVFSAGLASTETLAHLELLAARGELTRTELEGVYFYGEVSQTAS